MHDCHFVPICDLQSHYSAFLLLLAFVNDN